MHTIRNLFTAAMLLTAGAAQAADDAAFVNAAGGSDILDGWSPKTPVCSTGVGILRASAMDRVRVLVAGGAGRAEKIVSVVRGAGGAGGGGSRGGHSGAGGGGLDGHSIGILHRAAGTPAGSTNCWRSGKLRRRCAAR